MKSSRKTLLVTLAVVALAVLSQAAFAEGAAPAEGHKKSVLELFESTKVRHLSAEDVYRALIAEGIDVGLATVYRVLTQFEQAGLLSRQHFETGKAVFELNQGGHHDHLVCLQCGRVEEFFDAEIEKRQTRIARERGFEISEHALYLYAECTRVQCPYRKVGGHD
jgi:Fur family ferric uptake transcriptional regulator